MLGLEILGRSLLGDIEVGVDGGEFSLRVDIINRWILELILGETVC